MDILGRDKIARFKHVGYSEIDRKAVQTYCANYDTENEVVMGDIVHLQNLLKESENCRILIC